MQRIESLDDMIARESEYIATCAQTLSRDELILASACSMDRIVAYCKVYGV